MTKKRIIIMGAAGLVSFAGTFFFTWQTHTRQRQSAETAQLTPAGAIGAGQEEIVPKLPLQQAGIKSSIGDSITTKAMAERELKGLIYEVREKMQEYDNKLQGLEVQEQRLQIAHNLIKADIEELTNLRTELASVVANLKSERDKLLKSRVEVSQAEKQNLVSIASTYDKMDASSAAKILTSMCSAQAGSEQASGGSIADAVKILHYMSERAKGKLLAELVGSEPKLAAVLCQRLKQVSEEQIQTQ